MIAQYHYERVYYKYMYVSLVFIAVMVKLFRYLTINNKKILQISGIALGILLLLTIDLVLNHFIYHAFIAFTLGGIAYFCVMKLSKVLFFWYRTHSSLIDEL